MKIYGRGRSTYTTPRGKGASGKRASRRESYKTQDGQDYVSSVGETPKTLCLEIGVPHGRDSRNLRKASIRAEKTTPREIPVVNVPSVPYTSYSHALSRLSISAPSCLNLYDPHLDFNPHNLSRNPSSTQHVMLTPILSSILLLLPAIHAIVGCLDPTIHQMTPPLLHPVFKDCAHVADEIYDQDTRRPPQTSTFGQHGDVDFIVPLDYHYKSCRAIINMRPDKEDQVGRTSITEFALYVMAIEGYCRQQQPPGFGGVTHVAGNMHLTVWGVTESLGRSGANVSVKVGKAAEEALRNGTRSPYEVLGIQLNTTDDALRSQRETA